MRMRAKFLVNQVKSQGSGEPPREEITMMAVSDSGFDQDGNSEDNTFARWTPTGELKMAITNPDLLGKIEVGQKYYLDFTKAEG